MEPVLAVAGALVFGVMLLIGLKDAGLAIANGGTLSALHDGLGGIVVPLFVLANVAKYR